MSTLVAQILWQAPRLIPLAAAVFVLALVGVSIFYIPQSRRLRLPWRWGLPLLRVLVCVALAASILQPALVRSESAEQPGAVVLLIDSSRSMGVVDPRNPAERVALADALGALPEDARRVLAPGLADELATLLKRVDDASAARADAEYAKLSGQGVIAAQTRYEELTGEVASRAAELAKRADAVATSPDLAAKLSALAAAPPDGAAIDYRACVAAVRSALDAAQSAADVALYDARPDVKRASDELAALTRAQLAERAVARGKGSVLDSVRASAVYSFTFGDDLRPIEPASPASRPSSEPRALRSDLVGGVREAAERMKGRPVQAILVLSDGRQIGGESMSSSLAAEGVPVYGVITGSRSPRDVSIADVMLAQRQFVGETTTARVRLRGSGTTGEQLNVRLDAGGSIQSRTVALGNDGSAFVEFPVRFELAAVHGVTIDVAALPGETTTANNVIRRWVVATADRATISLVGASASWDFQQARRALMQSPWAQVDSEVLDAPGSRWSVPSDEVSDRAAVILFDVTADHLSGRQWDGLYDLVTERGGTLIFAAGRNTTAPQFIDSPLLTDLLPFRAGARPAWRRWAGEHPLFRFQPAADAADTALLKLGGTSSSAAARWLDLSPVFQYLPVTDLKPNTTPLLVERESGSAVLTDSRLGLGHVLFFGVNETWRWRSAADGAAMQWRFWQQLARYAVDAPYAARSGAVRLDADRVMLSPGESLRVRARISHPRDETASDPTQPLTVLRDGAVVMTRPLAFEVESSGKYTASLDNLAAGTYQLQLRDPLDASIVAALDLHVDPDAESEMRDVSADERTLRRLAEASGGEVMRLDEWKTLPRRIAAVHGANRQVAEKRLWDSPQLFAFILGCLGIEWAMRKRLGLA